MKSLKKVRLPIIFKIAVGVSSLAVISLIILAVVFVSQNSKPRLSSHLTKEAFSILHKSKTLFEENKSFTDISQLGLFELSGATSADLLSLDAKSVWKSCGSERSSEDMFTCIDGWLSYDELQRVQVGDEGTRHIARLDNKTNQQRADDLITAADTRCSIKVVDKPGQSGELTDQAVFLCVNQRQNIALYYHWSY